MSCLVLEHVEGRSVKELVASGPLSVDQTIDIGSQIAAMTPKSAAVDENAASAAAAA